MIWNNLSALSNYDIIAIIDGIQSGAVDFTFDDLKKLQNELITRRMEARYMTMVGDIMRKMIEKEEQKEAEEAIPEPEHTARRTPTRVPYDSEDFASTMAIPTVSRRERMPEIEQEIQEEESPYRRERRDFSRRAASARRTPAPRPISKPTAAAIFEEVDDEEDAREFPALNFLVLLFKILGWICVGGAVAGFVIYSLKLGGDNLLLMAGILGIAIIGGVMALFVFYAMAESIELKLEIVRQLSKRTDTE